ncbi:MAG: TonB-dependent receptor [Robiginitomaculum sp.]|nr:MAG: TonB-dependent receptor [Robiginitomaculum sp.]
MSKNTLKLGLLAGTLLASSTLNITASAQVQDEIIVTATKRNERLIDVPLSISVVGAHMIETTGIRDLKEVAEYIPNVEISQGSDFRSSVTIRGVGAVSRNIGFDTRVGVYVDGIYMGQSPSLNQELLDLQQVEVLRGPQGTLFGKDTVAGAINLITKKPGDEFEGTISADLGNFGYTEFKGMVTVPLSDTVSFKGSISKADRDGFIRNTGTGNDLMGVDTLSYRGQLRFTPRDNLDINLSFDGLNSDRLFMVGEPVTDMLGLFTLPEDREVNFDFDPNESRDVYGVALTVEYELANGFTLKSLSGWRDTKAFFSNATDYSPTSIIFIKYTDEFEQFSQEFQLISPDEGKLDYVVGAYLYTQDAFTNRDVPLGDGFIEGFVAPFVAPAVAPLLGLDPANLTAANLDLISAIAGFGPEGSNATTNTGAVTTNNYALFLNANYELSDRLTLGIGARYSIVEKDASWILDGRNSGPFGIGTTNPDPITGAPTPLVNDRKDTAFSPAVSLTYAVTDTANVYAKYSSGFKSGGFNLDFINANELAANAGLEFDKETVDSYELGLKGTAGNFSFAAAAFLAEFSDYQVNQFIVLDPNASPPLTSIRITNAASVTSKGLELEASWRPTDELTFQGTLGFLDATFDVFPGGATGGTDAAGKALPGAPDFSATFGGQYIHSLDTMKASVLLRADLTHRSGIFQSIDNIKTDVAAFEPNNPFDFGYAKALTQINGRIGFLPDSERFEIYFWGRNLTDEQQVVSDLQDFFGTKVRQHNIGRTYGVELVANF